MAIMKHTALVLTFAAVLAAQEVPKADPALVQAIAKEEQEGDLAKAERLYREALAGSALSEAERAQANRRLGRLLQKLGRGDEAKPFVAAGGKDVVSPDDVTAAQGQDAERTAKLRAKAEELIDKLPLPIQELIWIGEAAVPVVIARIEEIEKSPQQDLNTVTPLAGLLWHIGGPEAAAFLRRAAGSERLAGSVSGGIRSITRPEMWQVAEPYLRLSSSNVAWMTSMQRVNSSESVLSGFDADAVVDAAMTGDAAKKAWLLQRAEQLRGAGGTSVSPQVVARLVALAKDSLDSVEPELGMAARQFLLGWHPQQTRVGLALLLQQLPRLPGDVRPNLVGVRLETEEWRSLLPDLDACAKALADNPPYSPRRPWLTNLMTLIPTELGDEAVPHFVRWFDLGFYPLAAVAHRVTTATAAAWFGIYPKIEPKDRVGFARVFAKIDLPAALLPALQAAADSALADRNQELLGTLCLAIGQTGNVAAADWLLATWRAELPSRPYAVVDSLWYLAQKTQAEPVRAAMRAVAADTDTGPNSTLGERLVLALLAMSDVPALDLVAAKPTVAELTLLLQKVEPAQHAYTEEQLLAFVRELGRQSAGDPILDPRLYTTDLISDRLLVGLADHIGSRETTQQPPAWHTVAIARLNRANGEGELATWFTTGLAAGRLYWDDVYRLSDEAFAKLRPMLEQGLASDDAGVVTLVADHLLRRNVVLDVDRLLQNKAFSVREWVLQRADDGELRPAVALVRPLLKDGEASMRTYAANYLGAQVDKESVPGLLERLRDPEASVRTAATNALTRIRFFHEQQAHWDRVLKGLDASPASAAEKLLLQAKPDAPRAQRLLAITSLGTLGVPEALPFLIDWAQDQDAEIAQKAREAITQIHLNPRR